MTSARIPLQLLSKEIDMPAYAYSGDAGVDISSTVCTSLQPFERKLIPCGFSLALPKGYCALICPRSGLAVKQGITVLNAPGVIDSNYRGEIKVSLINLDPKESFDISVGTRIAQMLIMECPAVEFLSVDTLEETQRGTRGFGSSGW